MEDIADAIIGSAESGLAVEQRKRVTIGVELAAKPELLLFLDEPTRLVTFLIMSTFRVHVFTLALAFQTPHRHALDT